MHEVDAVRLLTFSAVIAVHAVWSTNPMSSVAAGWWLVLLHFTRGTFFVISGFVLLRGQLARPLPARALWRRRFPPVLVPYLVWTVLYWLNWVRVSAGAYPWEGRPLAQLVEYAWSGEAAYHLYFLLVSMQLYLLVPAVAALVRRTRGHHGLLLAGALVLQAALLWVYHDVDPPSPGWLELRGHAPSVLPVYVGYVAAGALAAAHFDRFDAWVRSHGRAVLALVLAVAGVAELAYWLQVRSGTIAWWSADALQPVVLLWSLAVSLGLYAVGCAYARRRAAAPAGRLARWVTEGSQISFGVYLVHPLVLGLLVEWLLNPRAWALRAPGSTVVAWVLAVVVSVALVEGLSRTPLSLALTGRPRRRRAAQVTAPPSSPSSPAPSEPTEQAQPLRP